MYFKIKINEWRKDWFAMLKKKKIMNGELHKICYVIMMINDIALSGNLY